MKAYQDYITIDTNIRFGKPVLKDTRIAVSDILNWLSNGMTMSEITQDFPEINEEMILACLAFVANRENNILVA
jgi:uncharacterized protein (DUF433 family)